MRPVEPEPGVLDGGATTMAVSTRRNLESKKEMDPMFPVLGVPAEGASRNPVVQSSTWTDFHTLKLCEYQRVSPCGP